MKVRIWPHELTIKFPIAFFLSRSQLAILVLYQFIVLILKLYFIFYRNTAKLISEFAIKEPISLMKAWKKGCFACSACTQQIHAIAGRFLHDVLRSAYCIFIA